MTTTEPNTTAFFREALARVRSAPLSGVDTMPPLGGWPSPAPTPAPARPLPISGRSGDLWELRERLVAGELTVTDLDGCARERTSAYSNRFGAYVYAADTHHEAARMQAEIAAGRSRGPLHGIPIAVKDVIHVAGMPTGGGSDAYPVRVAPVEGEAVRRLRAAGALLNGKVATHEFALGVTTPQSRNPWDASRIPGGSSGGSAIAVVTGMAAASLGTDTRASIRVPAALTGAVGFKPSFNRVPVDGLITLSWSMDHLAPMARSVRDIALLMDVLTASPGAYTTALPGELAGRRVRLSPALLDGADAAVARVFSRTLDAIESAGATVDEGDSPTAEDLALANAAGLIISRCEAATYHAELGTDLARCTPETRLQLAAAAGVPAGDYLRAQRLRAELRARMLASFGDADALIMPASKVLAPRVEDADDYLLVLAENCIPWSLLDLPAIVLPAGMADGLPVGVQLVGRPGGDTALLALAHGLETVLPPLPEWEP